jgi:hypothetical protein
VHLWPAGQQARKERYHQQRWIVRLDQQVNVVSHVLEGGNPGCAPRAVVYRPRPEAPLALRGSTVGLDVVARIGELRYREKAALTQIRAHLPAESPLAISRPEVAIGCEVFLAVVTMVARQDQALIEHVRTAGGLLLAMDGVPPDKRHAPLCI